MIEKHLHCSGRTTFFFEFDFSILFPFFPEKTVPPFFAVVEKQKIKTRETLDLVNGKKTLTQGSRVRSPSRSNSKSLDSGQWTVDKKLNNGQCAKNRTLNTRQHRTIKIIDR